MLTLLLVRHEDASIRAILLGYHFVDRAYETHVKGGAEAKGGGELVLRPFLQRPTVIAPRFDRAVLFRSDRVLHRVLPCHALAFVEGAPTWGWHGGAAAVRPQRPSGGGGAASALEDEVEVAWFPRGSRREV